MISLLFVLTALYEFGGDRSTNGLNDGKGIKDCAQFVENIFNSGTVTTGTIMDGIEKIKKLTTEEDKGQFLKSNSGKLLGQADKIIHYNMYNISPDGKKYAVQKLLDGLEDGDMVVWRGHVGFVAVDNGKKHLLSYTRERGESQESTVAARTFNHFTEHVDYSGNKQVFKTSNTDGFTKSSQESFSRLISIKDLYVVKFPDQLTGVDSIPAVEDALIQSNGVSRGGAAI